MYRKANIFGAGSLSGMVKEIAALPLLHQPGEVWEYSVSTEVLGRVVEVASGMDFDRFVEARITGPLRMNDTGFWVKPMALARVAMADGPPNSADAGQKPAILSGDGAPHAGRPFAGNDWTGPGNGYELWFGVCRSG